MIKNNIVIKNIYYMFAYVFEYFQSKTEQDVTECDFDNIDDLFAVILSSALSLQIKRGLNKEYENKQEELSTLRGKIDFQTSIKKLSHFKCKLFCEYDEFTLNSYFNNIIKSSCELLLTRGQLTCDSIQRIKRVLPSFLSVDSIDLKRVSWNSIRYNSNNRKYKLLIHICYMIAQGMLMTEEAGDRHLSNYFYDKCMGKLFERFVLTYYKKNLKDVHVHAPKIPWAEDNLDFEYLPEMQTDIVLETDSSILIIDAKFYTHSLNKHSQYEDSSAKLHSGNMYQIFTYMKNMQASTSKKISGMLLYAKTQDKEIAATEKDLLNNKFFAKSIDLDCEWSEIESTLKGISNNVFKLDEELMCFK